MALQNFGINDTTIISVALKFELCAANTFVWPLHIKNARPFVVVDVVIIDDVRKEIKFVRNPPPAAVLSRAALARTIISCLS